MTVKNYIASGALDPANPKQKPLPAEETEGHVKFLVSTQETANGDSITSTIKFGSIPSNARILRNSTLDYDAVTGLTDFDLGIGKTIGGVYDAKAPKALINSADIHLAGSKAMTALDIANLPKAAWELAGYTQDPGGNVEIRGTFNAAPSTAATITLTLLFATP